jgi:hypothetical protein
MSELATLGLARRGDAREIAEMSRDLIEFGLTWSWTPARVQHFISGPESSVIVARRDRHIAAFAIMHFGDEVAHLNLLAVSPPGSWTTTHGLADHDRDRGRRVSHQPRAAYAQ